MKRLTKPTKSPVVSVPRRPYGKKRYRLDPQIARAKQRRIKEPDYRDEEYVGEMEFD